MTDFAARLRTCVDRYRVDVAVNDDDLIHLLAAMAASHRLEDRRTYPGHVTTSAIVVTPDLSSVLLVHHRALDRWLQPGGHWEPAATFWASALREAQEETGIEGATLHPWHGGRDIPIDIDTHAIPLRIERAEPSHWHHDLRFAFVADATLPLRPAEAEVVRAAWKPFALLAEICPRVHDRLLAARA
jgi:8-oxo-dGTP pyrophosphatase MutT (NUDIX family)